MFTEPEIKSSNGRSYIEFYFNGQRQREYNAKKLSLSIFPNKATTVKERSSLLRKLKLEFEKALEEGWNPETSNTLTIVKPITLEDHINESLNTILNGNYSRTYKRGIKAIGNKFLNYLSISEKIEPIDKIEPSRLLSFLNQFNTSNRNYMNYRQYLNVLLPGTIAKTPRKKYAETLHQIYQMDEMKAILEFLKINYPKLHVVALLTYGCFVRPHEEARLLQKFHIKEQKIYLSGDENKGKRVRVIHIPDYIYTTLKPLIENCIEAKSYLFTGSEKPLNHDYFRTQWTRAKHQLIRLNLIQENQTLYSFRHTGAVSVYRQTKDVHILQQLLGHSSLIVTLKYLRGLGETTTSELKDFMPTL
jgi:integrase